MSLQQEPENCFFDIWQQEDILPPDLEYPEKTPLFYIQFRVNLIVRYLPHHYRMNVFSDKKTCPGFYDLPDKKKVHCVMSKILSFMPVPQQDVEPIINLVSSKAEMMGTHLSNKDRVIIPIVMSLRVSWALPFDQDLDFAWGTRLGVSSLRECGNLPAMESSVEGLDKVIYGIDDKGAGLSLTEEQLCPVCLVEFSDGEKVTRMPCLHVYHEDCIVKWLKKSHLCPSCRFPMPVCEGTEGLCPFQRKRVFRKPRARACWRQTQNYMYGIRSVDSV